MSLRVISPVSWLETCRLIRGSDLNIVPMFFTACVLDQGKPGHDHRLGELNLNPRVVCHIHIAGIVFVVPVINGSRGGPPARRGFGSFIIGPISNIQNYEILIP